MKTLLQWLNNNTTNFSTYINFYWLRNYLLDLYFEQLINLNFSVFPMDSPHELIIQGRGIKLSQDELDEFKTFGIDIDIKKQIISIDLKTWYFLSLDMQEQAINKLDKLFNTLKLLLSLYEQ